AYASILREIKSRGIQVYATVGDPSDVDHWRRVDHAITAVLAFNRVHENGFSGLQFDIEPYALKGFPEHRKAVYARYARLLRKIRIRIGRSLPWSVVIPFWFDQVRQGRGSLLTFVLRQADGITIMAYRSRYREILALARTGLCAGQLMDKPVDLGVEMAPMPDQSHYFLTRRQFSRDIRNHHGHLYFVGQGPPSGRIALHYECADQTYRSIRTWAPLPASLIDVPDMG
ncbi:amidase, partial [mine drainage metagenome]